VGIGDDIIVTGQAREMQLRDPRKVRIQYERDRWRDIWDNNPRLAMRGESGDFQILAPRDNYLRPYCSAKSPRQWTWKPYRPPVGEIYLKRDEEDYAHKASRFVIIEPNVKFGASVNKLWIERYWTKLVKMLRAENLMVAQLSPTTIRTIDGAGLINTPNFRLAAAMLKHARLVITLEGALHHAAAAMGTPAVVIYGGYISPDVTGYDGQVSLFRGDGLGCGFRTKCGHCADAMTSITPEEVFEAAMSVMR
jgi:ADP-heptose:LPS heptosyltransferase